MGGGATIDRAGRLLEIERPEMRSFETRLSVVKSDSRARYMRKNWNGEKN